MAHTFCRARPIVSKACTPKDALAIVDELLASSTPLPEGSRANVMSIQTQLQVLEAFPLSKLSTAKRATAPNGQGAVETGKPRAGAATDKSGGKAKDGDAERSGKKSKRKGDGDSERKSKKKRKSEAA